MGGIAEDLRAKISGKNSTVEEADVIHKIRIQRNHEFIFGQTENMQRQSKGGRI